jgi:hypothetical protein
MPKESEQGNWWKRRGSFIPQSGRDSIQSLFNGGDCQDSRLPFHTAVCAAVGPVHDSLVDSPCRVQNSEAEQLILQQHARSTAAAMFRTSWAVSNPAEEYQRNVSHGQHHE